MAGCKAREVGGQLRKQRMASCNGTQRKGHQVASCKGRAAELKKSCKGGHLRKQRMASCDEGQLQGAGSMATCKGRTAAPRKHAWKALN